MIQTNSIETKERAKHKSQINNKICIFITEKVKIFIHKKIPFRDFRELTKPLLSALKFTPDGIFTMLSVFLVFAVSEETRNLWRKDETAKILVEYVCSVYFINIGQSDKNHQTRICYFK